MSPPRPITGVAPVTSTRDTMWTAWLVTAPLAIALLPLTEPRAMRSPVTVLTWVAIGAVAWLAFAGVLVLARTAIPDVRRRMATGLAAGAFAGGGRSLVIGMLSTATPAVSSSTPASAPLAGRIITGAIIGIAWFGMVSIASQGMVEFRQRRRELAQEYAALQERRDERSARADALVTAVEGELRERLARLDDELGSGHRDDGELAGRLRGAAEDIVRPLSHRLGLREPHTAPRPSAREVVEVLARLDAAGVTVMCILVAAVSGPLIARQHGLGASVGALSLFFAATGVVTFVAVRAVASMPATTVLVGWTVGVIGAAAVAGGVLVATGVPTAEAVGWAAAAAIGFPTMTVLVDMGLALPRLRALTIDQYVAAVDRSRMADFLEERELDRAARTVAEHLHGTVQSDLLAAALALSTAPIGSPLRDQAVANVASAIRNPAPLTYPASSDDVDSVIRRWDGLIDVTVDDEGCLDSLGRGTRVSVASVVEEAIANAARHGRATSIQVRLTDAGDHVEVYVRDDGRYLDGTAGFGSRILDEHAASGWQRGPAAGGGTELSARIPVR